MTLSLAIAAAALLLAPATSRADDKDACIQAAEKGQVDRDKGKLLSARDSFLACSRASCPGQVRADCAGWLADVDARIPSVIASAKDPEGRDTAGARVSLDGALLRDRLDGKAISLDPGEHVFRFERPGSPPVDIPLILREGERRRVLDVRFRAPGEALPAKRPLPIPAIVLAPIGVAGIASFAVLAAMAKGEVDHLRATCAPRCASSDVDAARTKEIAANLSLGVGSAAIVAAAIYLIARPRDPAPAAVVPVAGGALAVFSRRF